MDKGRLTDTGEKGWSDYGIGPAKATAEVATAVTAEAPKAASVAAVAPAPGG